MSLSADVPFSVNLLANKFNLYGYKINNSKILSDKYKMKMEEPPEPIWVHEITKELIRSEGNEYYCHEH